MKEKYITMESGTSYKKETPMQIINIIESALKSHRNTRIRVFYGDKATGKDWLEEHDTIGYIGRSTGINKIPLIINNTRSTGGPAILDDCIVKITIDKRIVYKHPLYHTGDLTIKGTAVFCDGNNIANFDTNQKAVNFVDFLTGNRNRK